MASSKVSSFLPQTADATSPTDRMQEDDKLKIYGLDTFRANAEEEVRVKGLFLEGKIKAHHPASKIVRDFYFIYIFLTNSSIH